MKFKAAYDRYKEWSKDNGFQTCSRRTFKERLEKHVKIDVCAKVDTVFDYRFKEDGYGPYLAE